MRTTAWVAEELAVGEKAAGDLAGGRAAGELVTVGERIAGKRLTAV